MHDSRRASSTNFIIILDREGLNSGGKMRRKRKSKRERRRGKR